MLLICCMKFVDYPSFFDGSTWIGHMTCSALLECGISETNMTGKYRNIQELDELDELDELGIPIPFLFMN